jgi:hypothetical protein
MKLLQVLKKPNEVVGVASSHDPGFDQTESISAGSRSHQPLTLVVVWVETASSDVGFHPSTLSSTYQNLRAAAPIELRSKPNI